MERGDEESLVALSPQQQYLDDSNRPAQHQAIDGDFRSIFHRNFDPFSPGGIGGAGSDGIADVQFRYGM